MLKILYGLTVRLTSNKMFETVRIIVSLFVVVNDAWTEPFVSQLVIREK